MRKALCVGIDSYQNIDDLHGCVNDANAVTARSISCFYWTQSL